MVELEAGAEVGLGMVGCMRRSSQVRAVLRVAIGGDPSGPPLFQVNFSEKSKNGKRFHQSCRRAIGVFRTTNEDRQCRLFDYWIVMEVAGQYDCIASPDSCQG